MTLFFFFKELFSIINRVMLLSLLQKKIMLNMFLDTLMADPPPQCLVWLPLMHRLAHVENGKLNFHYVQTCYLEKIIYAVLFNGSQHLSSLVPRLFSL